MRLKNKKVILFGKGWLACNVLSQLLDMRADVTVITEPHRDFEPDLFDFAKRKGLSSVSYKIPDAPEIFDICLSVYFSKLIPSVFFDNTHTLSMNIHPSILPDYKGCSSLTWAIANGDKITGVTYHKLTPKVDQGDIYFQFKIPIHEYEFQIHLYHRAMYLAADNFKTAISNMVSGNILGYSGPEGRYYGRGVPNNGIIDQNWPEDKIQNYKRALIHPPFPGPEIK